MGGPPPPPDCISSLVKAVHTSIRVGLCSSCFVTCPNL